VLGVVFHENSFFAVGQWLQQPSQSLQLTSEVFWWGSKYVTVDAINEATHDWP
jgi:hypothetical protein